MKCHFIEQSELECKFWKFNEWLHNFIIIDVKNTIQKAFFMNHGDNKHYN